MQNKFIRQAAVGAVALLIGIAPLLSGPALAKSTKPAARHDSSVRHDSGKHLGWSKGKHKGWTKTAVKPRPATKWSASRYKKSSSSWKARRPVTKPRTTWSAGRYRSSAEPLNRRQTTNRIGQLISTSYYSSRSSAQAAATRSRRNGRTTTVGYDAPGRRWVMRVYNR